MIPVIREAKNIGGCNGLIMAALGASLLMGMLEHWDHIEERKWRRHVEQEREERRERGR